MCVFLRVRPFLWWKPPCARVFSGINIIADNCLWVSSAAFAEGKTDCPSVEARVRGVFHIRTRLNTQRPIQYNLPHFNRSGARAHTDTPHPLINLHTHTGQRRNRIRRCVRLPLLNHEQNTETVIFNYVIKSLKFTVMESKWVKWFPSQL